MNRLTDVVLIADIVINFFTPFRESPKKGARWVYTLSRICSHYVRGNFALDFIATIPIDLFLGQSEVGTPEFSLRVLRVFRLLHVVRLNTILHHWTATARIDLSLLELVKFAFMTFTTAHWLACFWGFIGSLGPSIGHVNEAIDVETWYVQDYHQVTWIQAGQFTEASAFELYSACLYTALSNVFGGPCEINPANYLEFWAQSFMMFVGSSLWAYIIGCGVTIVATLNPHTQEHRRIIGMLRYFVNDKNVDADLASRLRHYFNETSSMRYFASRNDELMSTMTAELRGEAFYVACRTRFSKVW